MRKATATMLLAGGLLAVPGASAAEAVTYRGKTSGGSTITLKRSGNVIRNIHTAVPTACTETTGSGLSRAGPSYSSRAGARPSGGRAR